MKKEVTALNDNIEDIGDAISGTISSSVQVGVQLINLPWIITRGVTEETSGLVDEIIG